MKSDSRRKYDKEFKINAVELFNNNNKPIKDIEDDLGITRGNLARWVRQYKSKNNDAFPGNGRMSGKDLEIYQLKKENAILKEERDILKKAMGIFSGPRR